MADLELCYLSAADALARFHARTLSPVELMEAIVARSEALEPRINVFTYTFYERALEQARRAEARYAGRGPRPRALEGIPVVVKDENTVKGERTTAGSLAYKDRIDTRTSLSVERILRAGAIMHARSTAPEFACAGVTHSRLWGVTRNPWNPEHTTGGSSGGAGGALAAGMTTLANGSDIWGSIRMPAACCGVLGFKPPYGRVPEDGPFNFDYYCHEGPLARSVADLALLENVMAGPHPEDITSLRPKLRIPGKLGDIAGWRVAYSLDLGFFEVDPEVARNTEAALDRFRELGATVEPVELGWTARTLTGASNHLGHLFGNYVASHLPRHRDEMTHYARWFGEFGRGTSAQDFLAAIDIANEMYATLGPILERHHVLVCPTLAVPAPRADYDPGKDRMQVNGVEVHPVWGWCMTYPFNMMARCPVLAVPSGWATNGVPTGIQIVARTYDDVRAFRAAAAYERVFPLFTADRRPAIG